MSLVRRVVAPVAAALFVLGVIFNTSFGTSVDATPPTTRVRIGVQHVLTTVPTEFPNAGNTGPRFTPTDGPFNDLVSTSNGQIISGDIINEQLTIRHDNVHVADSLILGDVQYMIQISERVGGGCPTGVVIEYTEVDGIGYTGDTASQIDARCPATMDHVHTHDMGLGVRLGSGSTLTNSYLFANRTWTGAHREAIISNGPGDNIVVDHNTIVCAVALNCSSAMSLYEDFGDQSNWLITNNLFATSGGYCLYAGSEEQQEFFPATNIKVIGNRFSTQYNALCGVFGYMTAFEPGGGNEFTGNVWHETGVPIADQ